VLGKDFGFPQRFLFVELGGVGSSSGCFAANLCLLIGIKSPGIPQLVTKVHNNPVNGQKSGFSGVGAVPALKHYLPPEEIAQFQIA
jgi:hypothetical protein